MTTANLMGSHLNPQQSALFAQTSQRKRWIYSPSQDHLALLAAEIGRAAINRNKVVVWYDDPSSVERLLDFFPLNQIGGAIYTDLTGRDKQSSSALFPLAPAESIHHIELYKLGEDLERVSNPWKILHEDLWPGTNRYDLVQKFAGMFDHSHVNPLFYKLSATSFQINPAEYKKLRNKIEHHIKLNKLRQDGFSVLEILDVNLLINHSLDFVKNEVMQFVSIMSSRASELLRQADWINLRYFNYVKSYWIRELNSYRNHIDKWLVNARELHLMYGDAFTFESSMNQLADRFRGQISRKAKMISQDRKAIKEQYLELLTLIEQGQPWVQIPAEKKHNSTLAEAIEYIQELRHSIMHARESIETHIRSQLKRLNSHNAPGETNLSFEIKEWEEDLSRWYSDINISGYFKSRFESQALSMHRSMEILREINDSLSSILDRQHLLEDYFFWAGFQNQFPEPAKVVVQALHLVPHCDWLTYFDEWFITQLITGDALEVEWPTMPTKDVKALHQQIRQHLLAEFHHETQHARLNLSSTNTAEIRRIKSSKTGIDVEAADQYLQLLSPDQRSEWYPVQFIQFSQLQNAQENFQGDLQHFFYLQHPQPHLHDSWNLIQDTDVEVYATAPCPNQRYSQIHLHTPNLIVDFKLGQSRTSSTLKHLTQIARQFVPFLDKTCIYSAHRVNVISMLGQDLDRQVLDQLPMPYKISEQSLHPDENFLIETLLEPNNPFVLLLRDGWATGSWPENILWHVQFQEDMEKLGIKVIHSWSKGWLFQSESEIREIRDEILHHVGSTFTGIATV